MKIKITMTYPFYIYQHGQIQNTDITKSHWGGRASFTARVDAKWYTATWEGNWQFLRKLNILLPYEPTIMVLGIYSKELKTSVQQNSVYRCFCLFVFNIYLFIWLHWVAYRIFNCDMCSLVPWPGIELQSPALGAQSLSHWTTRKSCLQMSLSALFIIAKTWKQPRCPSVDEWIAKHNWYTQIMKYCSLLERNYQAMKRHGVSLHACY